MSCISFNSCSITKLLQLEAFSSFILNQKCLNNFKAQFWIILRVFLSSFQLVLPPLFQPVQTSEHMGALGVFGLCQIVNFINYLRSKLSPAHFAILWQTMLYIVGGIFAVAVGVLTLSGW